MKEIFTSIYESQYKELWAGSESRSGIGSSKKATKTIRKHIKKIIKEYDIKSIADCGCGDFNWMKLIINKLGVRYTGIDIVDDLVEQNNILFSTDNISFVVGDITSDIIPKSDLIIARDVLVHFSFDNIKNAISNFSKSGSKYLLLTSFVKNRNWDALDIKDGQWRTLNFCDSPYFKESIIKLFNENCTEGNGSFDDKSLMLIDLSKTIVD